MAQHHELLRTGDGALDLAVANCSGHVTDSTPDGVHLLYGDGKRHFAERGGLLGVAHAPTNLAIGDVTGDGHPDVVAGAAAAEIAPRKTATGVDRLRPCSKEASLHKIAFAALALAMLGAATAHAGSKSDGQVTARRFAGIFSASGSVNAAAGSADSNQFIGCKITRTETATTASCFASDASNTSGSCVTSDPAFVQLVSTITPDSYISFSSNEKLNFTCYHLEISTDSRYYTKR